MEAKNIVIITLVVLIAGFMGFIYMASHTTGIPLFKIGGKDEL